LARLRMGVVGLGGMGSTHLRNLLGMPGVEVVGAADIDEAKLAWAASLGVKPYRDYRELVGRVDAVVVATPPFLHREQAVYALERGVHVFLEKPMATSLGDAEAIVEAAERGGATLAVGYCLRFHRGYVEIARRAGGLGGPLVLAHWSSFRLGVSGWLADPAKSGGLLNENAVHVLYVFYWLGGPYRRVQAMLRRRPGGVEEAAVFQGEHVSGALSSLSQSWVAEGGRGWLLAYEEGSIIVEGYVEGRARVVTPGGVEEFSFSDGSMYVEEMRDFVEAVAEGRDPLVTGRDGLEVQRAVEEAYRSAGVEWAPGRVT